MNFLLALFLATPAFSQEIESFDIPYSGECGLVTRYDGTMIKPSCLLEALNVVLDEDLVIRRRNGQAAYNSIPCTDAKKVRGLWPFSATDGTEYLVILSSVSMFYTSGDGSCTRITGINGLSSTADMQCVQSLGKLYCVNGTDTPFTWDGTSTSAVSGMPTGSLVGAFRNRIVTADISGSRSRIRLSGELDGSDWTIQVPGRSTTPVSIDISGLNDGKKVTCLIGEYQNAFIIGRNNDLWALSGNDRRDFTLRNISREIGCTEPRSAREKNNSRYWVSHRGVERLTGTTISRASDPIRPTIDEIISAAGNTLEYTDTSQSDFAAGSVDGVPSGSPMNTNISPGNVTVSSWSVVDTSSADWAGGTLGSSASVADVTGSLTLSSRTIQDNFDDGNFTSTQAWTVVAGSFVVTGSKLSNANTISSDSNLGNRIRSYEAMDSGRFGFDFYYTNSQGDANRCGGATANAAGDCVDFRFLYIDANNYYSMRIYQQDSSEEQQIFIEEMNTGVANVLSTATANFLIKTTYTVVIERGQNGYMDVYVDNVFKTSATDTSLSGSIGIEIALTDAYDDAGGHISRMYLDNVDAFQYYSTAAVLSQIYDTTFSTPVGGTFSVSVTTSVGETSVYFDIRESSSPNNDFWSVLSASSDSLRVPLQKRYWQYQARLNTLISTKTPSIQDVTLQASNTGYFISQCRNPGPDLTSWGRFSCNTAANGGSFTFYVSTGPNCNSVTRSTVAWNTQTNNSVISIATAPYIAYRTLFSIDSGTHTPKLQDCTIRANIGTSRPSVAAEVYRDRYWLFYTTSTDAGASNSHALILDQNDKWTLFDNISAYSAAIYDNSLYTGDATDTGILRIQDVGSDDSGSSYRMRFRTPDLSLGNPIDVKSFRNLYVYLRSAIDPAQDIDINFSFRVDASTTAVSLGACDLREASEPGLFVCRMPFPTSDVVDAHWISLEGDYSGKQGPVSILGMKLDFFRKEIQ